MKCDTCQKKKYECSGYGKTPNCSAYISDKKQTNADRIRSMNDKELAEFLHRNQFSCKYEWPAYNGDCYGECTMSIQEWLQSEVKEVHDVQSP